MAIDMRYTKPPLGKRGLNKPFALSQVSPAYARQGASSEQIYTLFGHCLTIFHILQVFDRYTNKKLFVESLSKGGL